MKRKRFSAGHIVGILKEVEVGAPVAVKPPTPAFSGVRSPSPTFEASQVFCCMRIRAENQPGRV